MIKCSQCKGTGYVTHALGVEKCSVCKGTGYIEQAARATPADQEPLGWAWERRYSNGGYTRRFCATEDEARELAKDGESLGSPDLVYPFFVSATPADHSKLQVWSGSMPESNGKTNYTAILHRGDLSEGFTIDRSEYPDRVRYEADRVRWLIGEIDKEPCILDYDADKHSGYVAPQPPQNAADHIEAQSVRDAEVADLRKHVAELQKALFFWMPSIAGQETSDGERAANDAYLLYGWAVGDEENCYGDRARDAVIEECAAAIRKAEFSKQDDEYMTGMEAVSVIRALKSAPPQKPVSDEAKP